MPQYFFANGGEQRGPYSLDELASFGLRPDTLVWREGLAEWQRADSLDELVAKTVLLQAAAKTATPAQFSSPTQTQQPQLNYQMRSTVPVDGMGVASLVLGIISIPGVCLYGLGIVPGILAIVFGFIARARVQRGESGGPGVALAGLVLGFISSGLVVIVVVALVAIALVASMK